MIDYCILNNSILRKFRYIKSRRKSYGNRKISYFVNIKELRNILTFKDNQSVWISISDEVLRDPFTKSLTSAKATKPWSIGIRWPASLIVLSQSFPTFL